MRTVAVFGATGAVGREMVRMLVEREFPASRVRLFATARSAGSTLEVGAERVTVEDVATADLRGIAIAFLSAGGAASLALAPRLASLGTYVVDNSSAFRMDPAIPLVVPAINGGVLEREGPMAESRIIANPNCSTTILLMPLAPIHAHFGLNKVIVSTYQAVSGAGHAAVCELEAQIRGYGQDGDEPTSVFGRPIHLNLLPQIGTLNEEGYCQEETKIVVETYKILGDSGFPVVPTTVRVPTMRCHAESVYVETRRPTTTEEILSAWRAMPGLFVHTPADEPPWPTPRALAGRDETSVGRLRRASEDGHGFAFWVVGDQLLRGAALNAVEIGELVVKLGRA